MPDFGHFDNDGHLEPMTVPIPSKSPSAATMQDAGGRPKRDRKPVSRLIPDFKGKSYGTTMAQISNQMVGMTRKQSIRHMEQELEAMESHDGDYEALGVIMANLSLNQSIKSFGRDKTMAACKAEMKQIHLRNTFVPKHYNDLTLRQRSRMVESFQFLKEKRDGTLKDRLVLGGNVQQDYISKDEASSPTAYTEAIIITCIIDAKEGRDVAMADLPNAFCQTEITDEDAEHRVIVRIRGAVVDILCEIDSDFYTKYVTTNKKGEKVLLVQCMNALYGSMVASLMFYKKMVAALKSYGFEFNPYDSCVANKIVDGTVLTICFHVDDCKISHVSSQVVDETISLLRNDFEVLFEDGSGAMQVQRGKKHVYLGMSLDYSRKGEVHISMFKYIEDICDVFNQAQLKIDDGFVEVKKRKRSSTQMTAAPKNLFDVDEDSKPLSESLSESFHSIVAKALWAAKRARPDIMTSMSYLTKRVKNPNQDDWVKLKHMVKYLESTMTLPLILSADGNDNIYTYADSAFAVHPDMKSHNGAFLTLGRGAAISISSGQKLNTSSSTWAEIVCVSDILPTTQWIRLFMLSQRLVVNRNVIYQDNDSSVLLEKNGKKSSSKRTRHINIRTFLVTDAIAREECEVEWISRDYMYADYLTKAQQGAEFTMMRDFIMGVNPFN